MKSRTRSMLAKRRRPKRYPVSWVQGSMVMAMDTGFDYTHWTATAARMEKEFLEAIGVPEPLVWVPTRKEDYFDSMRYLLRDRLLEIPRHILLVTE